MELLAPAGSFEAAKAAVAAGADAIYMGGPLFSARAYAESSREGKSEDIISGDPEKDPLLKSVRYCHLFGVKVYMTLNTLLKDSEMSGLQEYLQPYVNSHIDAFIVQDIGLLKWLKERFSQIPVHISTQAAVTGPRFAKRLLEFGASRVVPARELSLSELREIADTGIEVEAFIHGALCYAYSGQCLMSSFIGCRSGNRGRCAGTCRLPVEIYDARMRRVGEDNENYMLSMRDLCALERLDEMEKAGVCSLKIEGRMKSPLYVAGVTSIYRKWLDKMGKPDIDRDADNDRRNLAEIFDRGGFTDCYLDGKNGRDCLILKEKPDLRIPDPLLVARITEKYIEKEPKIKICMKGVFTEGKPATLGLYTEDGKFCMTVSGKEVQRAQKKPLTKEEILEKTAAFGNTDFELTGTDILVGDSVFIPVGELKELRRRACEGLEKSILES